MAGTRRFRKPKRSTNPLRHTLLTNTLAAYPTMAPPPRHKRGALENRENEEPQGGSLAGDSGSESDVVGISPNMSPQSLYKVRTQTSE